MIYTKYIDVYTYMEETFPYLLPYEAQNNLIIANVLKMQDQAIEDVLMLSIKNDDGEILLIGLMTPPFNLLLFEPHNTPQIEATTFLATTLHQHAIYLPGVIGEGSLVKRFADLYTSLTYQTIQLKFDLNLYSLEKVYFPETKVRGYLRALDTHDIIFYPYWWQTFVTECHLPTSTLEESSETFHKALEKESVYIWEDQMPVSTVAIGRKLSTGVCISQVYTPPFFRKKGYASLAVATLSQKLLEEGYRFVCLFADALNPTSNKVYTHIGYELICSYQELMFQS